MGEHAGQEDVRARSEADHNDLLALQVFESSARDRLPNSSKHPGVNPGQDDDRIAWPPSIWTTVGPMKLIPMSTWPVATSSSVPIVARVPCWTTAKPSARRRSSDTN